MCTNYESDLRLHSTLSTFFDTTHRTGMPLSPKGAVTLL